MCVEQMIDVAIVRNSQISCLNKMLEKKPTKEFLDDCCTILLTAFGTMPISSSVFLIATYLKIIHKTN